MRPVIFDYILLDYNPVGTVKSMLIITMMLMLMFFGMLMFRLMTFIFVFAMTMTVFEVPREDRVPLQSTRS